MRKKEAMHLFIASGSHNVRPKQATIRAHQRNNGPDSTGLWRKARKTN